MTRNAHRTTQQLWNGPTHIGYNRALELYDLRAQIIMNDLGEIKTCLSKPPLDAEPLAQRLYEELAKNPIELSDALEFSRYSRRRIDRHSPGKLYDQRFLECDRTLTEIPYQMARMSPKPGQLIDFFRLIDTIESQRDFDGKNFTTLCTKAYESIHYVLSLDKTNRFVLSLVEAHSGNWDHFEAKLLQDMDSQDPQIKKSAEEQSEIGSELQRFEKSHNIPLSSVYAYIKSRR